MKEAFLWVSFYPLLVHLVSVLSTKVAILGKKMRYLFLSLLLYSNTVDMRQAYRQYCLAGFKISMTQEERENLISGFLSANTGNTDENTTRMLNMLVESRTDGIRRIACPALYGNAPQRTANAAHH